MGNGGDALLVPNRRKNRMNEARQATPLLRGAKAVQRDHSRVAEIADGNGLSAGRREHNAKATVP
jgi:hypothetical protein